MPLKLSYKSHFEFFVTEKKKDKYTSIIFFFSVLVAAYNLTAIHIFMSLPFLELDVDN